MEGTETMGDFSRTRQDSPEGPPEGPLESGVTVGTETDQDLGMADNK